MIYKGWAIKTGSLKMLDIRVIWLLFRITDNMLNSKEFKLLLALLLLEIITNFYNILKRSLTFCWRYVYGF